MAIRFLAVLLLAGALGGADVVPGGCCGGSHRNHEYNAAPGEACGGPARCLESTTCAVLDQSFAGSGFTSSYVCTKACGSDADCGGLSVAMRCTGSGRLGGSASQPVCLPAQ